MATRRFRNSLSRLDTMSKWVLLSAAAIALSTVLPWYEDRDAFGAGDIYLGVTGPLFLVGLMVLASAVFVGAWIVLPQMGKRLPKLPIQEGAIFVFLGLQDLVLLLIANSVFFHPKFGVNITLKSTRFGMILSFVAVVVMIWSSYKMYRGVGSRTMSSSASGDQEPLIKMPETPERRIGHRQPMSSYGRDEAPSRTDSPLKRDDKNAQPLRMDL